MRRQWILIGQSILKTIRTIGDKKYPSRGGRNRMRTCAKSRHGDQWVNVTSVTAENSFIDF